MIILVQTNTDQSYHPRKTLAMTKTKQSQLSLCIDSIVNVISSSSIQETDLTTNTLLLLIIAELTNGSSQRGIKSIIVASIDLIGNEKPTQINKKNKHAEEERRCGAKDKSLPEKRWTNSRVACKQIHTLQR
jgi:hypothetical protein